MMGDRGAIVFSRVMKTPDGRSGDAAGSPALAAALQARDPRAADQAWVELSPLVARLLRRFFPRGTDQQDLCQEVFLRFFARIDELRNPLALRSFLIGICLGVTHNELRRARVRRWVQLTPSGELPESRGFEMDPAARELMGRFHALLDRLGIAERTMFVMRYVEKMDVPEIAAAHQMSLSTTKRKLTRATRRIAACMRAEPGLAELVEAMLPGQEKGR